MSKLIGTPPFHSLSLVVLLGLSIVGCFTQSTSLGTGGKKDAGLQSDSGSTQIDTGKIIVIAPQPDGGAEVMCVSGGVSYKPGDIITLSPCTTCLCLPDGTVGRCTGACPPDPGQVDAARDTAAPDTIVSMPDTGIADASGLSALCTSTGGQVGQSLCCGSASDFPSSCLVGACSCAPTSSHTVASCSCPNGGCFDPTSGCSGPSGICTFGADQSCNDSLMISSTHGRCMESGQCVCTSPYKLLASGKCS